MWQRLPPGGREVLESDLAATDLQTLLLAVARARAGGVTPAGLTRRWQDDRFVRPSAADPRRLSEIDTQLWRLLPQDIAGVELSPVVPLGCSSVVSGVSQNRVVTTVRGTEVVSDSTNALALELALRRRGEPRGDLHLAASSRQLRAQVFGQGTASHFRLFALASTGRDSGSGRTEARLLIRHLAFWRQALELLVPDRAPVLELSVFDDPVLAERLHDTVLPALAAPSTVSLVEDPARTRGRGYYSGLALRICLDGGASEIGDGGLTTWTAQLTGNAKERCLVSCLSTEALAMGVISPAGGSASGRTSP